MTPPDFWYNPHISVHKFKLFWLVLLSHLIYWGGRLRALFTLRERLPIPVICVGNFTVGGGGKTPTTISIARYYKGQGHKPAIVSRGYRGRLLGPVKVDPTIHTCEDVGDEPLMMAAHFDVFIARHRASGAKMAYQSGADIIIMDDGLQHPSLYQDLKLSVVDRTKQFGNQKLIPAGPLREPLERGLRRVDSLVVIRTNVDEKPRLDQRLDEMSCHDFPTDIPQITATMSIDKNDWVSLKDKKLVAFAGLAHPDKFFSLLNHEGFNVQATKSYPDHHVYSQEDLDELTALAEHKKAQLITTEKDFIRLPKTMKTKVFPVRISLEYDNLDTMKRYLDSLLHSFSRKKRKQND